MGKGTTSKAASKTASKVTRRKPRKVKFNEITQTDSGNEMSTSVIETQRIQSNAFKPNPKNKYSIRNYELTSDKNREPYHITHFQTKDEHITAKIERDHEKGSNPKWKIEYIDDNGNKIENPSWKIKSINKEEQQATWCQTLGAMCAYSAIAFGVYSTINAGKTRRLKKKKTKRRY